MVLGGAVEGLRELLFGRFLYWLCEKVFALGILLSIAYSLGWVDRLVWWIAEKECSKLLNHTKITAGSLEFDLWNGRYQAKNIIIFAPQQHLFHWESPILSRVGHLYIELNLVSCIFYFWFIWREIPVEIYTCRVSDIQVFVERQHGIYNFFLLDPHIVLPNFEELNHPGESQAGDKQMDQQQQRQQAQNGASPDHNGTTNDNSTAKTEKTDDDANEKAQQVVDDIVDAVRTAATSNNWKNSLWQNFRHTLHSQFQTYQNNKKSEMLQESVQVLKHLSVNIQQKQSKKIQETIQPKRKTLPNEMIVYGRVGRLDILDLRIFGKRETTTWNKPIRIPKLSVKPHEFQVKDVVYQNMEDNLQVVVNRILTESAKSSGFLNTAMLEMTDALSESKR